MKHLLMITAVVAKLMICAQASECVPQKIRPKGTIESRMISLLEDGKRCMAVAQFGIYKAVAVLNLEPQNSATTKDYIPIKGTYYYVKHAKKIHLQGRLETKANRIVMNEYYLGKSTGHFQFSGNDSGRNYWSPPESTEEDKALLIHAFPYDSSLGEQDITSMRFHSIVKVRDHMMPKETPLYEVDNNVWACKLPDNSLAFQIYVMGEDFHIGRLNGIAISDHQLGNNYLHSSLISGEKCKVWIELNENKNIIFKNEDCDACCGAWVGLTGEYNYKDERTLFFDVMDQNKKRVLK